MVGSVAKAYKQTNKQISVSHSSASHPNKISFSKPLVFSGYQMLPLVFAYLKDMGHLLKNKKKFTLVMRSSCFWHKKQKQQVHNSTFRWQLVTRFVIVKVTAPASSPHLTYFKPKGGKMRGCDAALQLG